MKCEGLHCPGCGDHGGAPLIAILVVLGAMLVWWLITIIWLVAIVVGLALAAGIAVLVWMARRGAEVAMVSRSAVPPPQATPLPSRPSQALLAPREVHIHLHGLDASQAAGVASRLGLPGRGD